MKRFLIAVLALVLAGPALAQTFPPHTSTAVNDFADLLDAEAEARVTRQIETLKADTGVELTVVTIESLATYGGKAIENYTTGLFNDWGVGNAARNDGIMILVSEGDREMRLELGAGYPSSYDWLAEDVIDQTMLPRFRDGDLQGGIEAGVTDTIDRIARPFNAGQPAPPEPARATGPTSGSGGWMGFGFIAVIVAAVGGLIAKGPISRMLLARQACPQCGRTGGLSRNRTTVQSATTSSSGLARIITTCSFCSYHDEQTRTLPRITRSSSSSGGSFGGGRSAGGGASGKW